MRLFVALKIPAEVREKIAALVQELREVEPQAKWIRAENLHVTLKFIGEPGSSTAAEIGAALSKVRTSREISGQFQGLGFFPNYYIPNVLWTGITGAPELVSLAAQIDKNLSEIGIPYEARPFSPHLTLARLHEVETHDKLRAAIGKKVRIKFGSLAVREFHLVESKLKPTGAEYTTLQSFPFVAAEA